MSLTVILPRWQEPTVIELTEELLQPELDRVSGSKLLVTADWKEGIVRCDTEFICLMEPDCLVSPNYFCEIMDQFAAKPYYRQLSLISPATAINSWEKKIFGYRRINKFWVTPSKTLKSSHPYSINIAFFPGAIMRTKALKKALKIDGKRHLGGSHPINQHADLVWFSAQASRFFTDLNYHLSLNPRATYVTTEDYILEDVRYEA